MSSFNFIPKTSKAKSTWCGNLTVYVVIYKVVHYLNEFWNLFLDKVCLKNEW